MSLQIALHLILTSKFQTGLGSCKVKISNRIKHHVNQYLANKTKKKSDVQYYSKEYLDQHISSLIQQSLYQSYQNLVDSSRILQTLVEYCRLQQNTVDSSRVLQTLVKYCRLYQNLVDSSRILQTLVEYCRLQQNIVYSSRILQTLVEYCRLQ